MAPNDEIWRPDYAGPPPVSPAASVDIDRFAGSDPGVEDGRGGRRWGARTAAASALVGAVALASTVVIGAVRSGESPEAAAESEGAVAARVDALDSTSRPAEGERIEQGIYGDRLDLLDGTGQRYVGADPRRLPIEVEPRWTVSLGPLAEGTGVNRRTWIEAVDTRYVVVGIGDLDSLRGPSVVFVLDAVTGRTIWVLQVAAAIDEVEFVAAIGDALVLTIADDVVAHDLRSGSQLWSSDLFFVSGSSEQVTTLRGTDLLARSSPEPGAPITLVEPATGAPVGVLTGDVLGSDGAGRWYVLRGDKVLEFDLARPSAERPGGDASLPGNSDELAGSELPDGDGVLDGISSELVGTMDSELNPVAAVVGDSLVTIVDGMLAVGALSVEGDRNVGAGGLTPLTVDVDRPQSLVLVRSIIPLAGSAFVTVGGGTISGAEVANGTIRFSWERPGTVTETFPTERGIVLLIGTEGGAAQTLVDAATGSTIAPLTMAPGLFDALEVVGNGIVTRRTSQAGSRIAGLDLDGEEMWSLGGTGPMAIGDRFVVRSTSQADGSFEVTAYGGGA